MRIDKFLKVSRLTKRRALAKEAADAGKIKANGRTVKAGYSLSVGDVIEISFNSGILKFKVLSLKETVKKEEASSLYEIIEG